MIKKIIEIPAFTAEDFYETDEPYSFLYAFKDDKFLLSQAREKMKAQAASVGVRGFVGLWNAYLETQQKQNGISVDNVTQFDGQEIELVSGKYICNDNGVVMADKYGYEVVVCRHPIMPIQRLVNIDSGEERIKIAFKKGQTWRTVIAEKSTIASTTSILQLAANGIMVNGENAKLLSTYLMELEQLNYSAIEEQRSVGRLGWVGGRQFAPYVADLEFDGEANFRHIFNSVRSNGDRDTWIEAMRKVRAERGAGRLFLAASFASVILEPCGLLPFFLHAWGGTEVGKTVGLMIAASVWASPKLGDYCTTFNSTAVGQEMQATFLNSLPMCMDELQIQSSAGVRDFDKIIYQLTEGVGRTRGAKTGGLQRQNKWRNCFITNGEHPISASNSGGGAVNRIIEFEVTEKVYSDLVGLCSTINENYGFAGQEFVAFLQGDGAIDLVKKLQRKYYDLLLQSDSTDKQAASAAAILAADEIANNLFFKDKNGLTVADVAAIMAKKDDVDVNKRALDFIYETVTANYNKFHANDFGEYHGEIWGKLNGTHIFFIKRYFDQQMADAGFNSSAFMSWAQRQGLLDTDKNRKTKNISIAGQTVRTVCIAKPKDLDFEEL